MFAPVFVVLAANTHPLEVLRQVLKPANGRFVCVPKFLHFVASFMHPVVFFGGSVAICPDALYKVANAVLVVFLFFFADFAQSIRRIVNDGEIGIDVSAASVYRDGAINQLDRIP